MATVANFVVLSGPASELDRFIRQCCPPDPEDDRPALYFQTLVPITPGDDCMEQWGCDGNCYDFHSHRNAPDELTLDFSTEDGVPAPIYRAIAKEFPTLQIHGRAEEPYAGPFMGRLASLTGIDEVICAEIVGGEVLYHDRCTPARLAYYDPATGNYRAVVCARPADWSKAIGQLLLDHYPNLAQVKQLLANPTGIHKLDTPASTVFFASGDAPIIAPSPDLEKVLDATPLDRCNYLYQAGRWHFIVWPGEWQGVADLATVQQDGESLNQSNLDEISEPIDLQTLMAEAKRDALEDTLPDAPLDPGSTPRL